MSEHPRLQLSKIKNDELNCRYGLRFNDIQKSSDELGFGFLSTRMSQFCNKNFTACIRKTSTTLGSMSNTVTDMYELIIILSYRILNAYSEWFFKSLGLTILHWNNSLWFVL